MGKKKNTEDQKPTVSDMDTMLGKLEQNAKQGKKLKAESKEQTAEGRDSIISLINAVIEETEKQDAIKPNVLNHKTLELLKIARNYQGMKS